MGDLAFLDGGGEMGERMRAHDWSTSPLGAPSGWPQSLRSVVGLMINSRYPMFCAWGPDLAFLYNDDYIPIFGAKHPHTLGLPFRDVWSDIWTDIKPLVDGALAGQSNYQENFHLVMERNGFPEDTWYDFSYSPVRGDDGAIAGMFCACTEKTAQLQADRALRESEANLRAVFAQLSEGVIIADTDGKLGLVNRAAERIHGVASLHVAPEDYSDVYHLFTEDGDPYPPTELPLARAVLHGEAIDNARWRIRRPDGSEVLAVGSARPIRDDEGQQIGSVLTVRDDTPRSEAELALRESELRFRNMADHAPVMMWVTEADGYCSYLNRLWYEFTGQTTEEALGYGWLGAVHPDDSEEAEHAFREASDHAAPFRVEYRLRRADGQYRWAIDAAAPRFSPSGEFLGFVGSVIEIDERRRFEALQAAQNKVLELALEAPTPTDALEALLSAVEDESGGEVLGSILLSDGDGHLLHGAAPSLPDSYNQAIHGVAIGNGVGSCGTAAFTKEPVFVSDITTDPLWADFKDLATEHGLRACWSIPIISVDDEVLGTFAMYYREPREPGGDDLRLVDYVTRTASLIIQRHRAAEALRKRSEEFFTLADNIPSLAWMAYADGSIFWYNRRWYEYTGTSPESQTGWGWESVHDPDMLPTVVERWTKSIKTGSSFEMTFPLRGSDGKFRPFLTRVVPILGDDGEILRWFGTNVDVTAQVEAEAQLQQLNATLEARVEQRTAERDRVWNVSQDLFVICGFDGTYRETNPAWSKQLGYPRDALIGTRFDALVHPDDVASTQLEFERLIRGAVIENFDIRIRALDGTYCWYSWTCVPEADSFYAAGRDVTQRIELEEQLRQSQKMETIGQLTGGIAHDFNNLLQIITGNLDIIRRTMPDTMTRQARAADNAMKGADRAAVLTQRLLAFARRQPLAPKVIDANKLVTGMSEMLHRTLGENLSLETVLGSGLWPIEADPNQLESALLNLAVNARDAMTGGGKLTIETTNTHIDRAYADDHSGVAPGQYTLICVSDTGAGMDPATAERAVEPFFTTKDVGKGTGLGLSMVYGFVKQSGGHFKIYSEPGQGTTVKIYLPRHLGTVTSGDERADDAAPDRSDGETILVCEDDADVRLFTAETLRDLGYRVVEADSGEEALRRLEGDPEVVLLFTDVVLPGITGAVLAAKAKAMRPALLVLYTTGYARNAIVHHGRLDAGVELLSKPFTRAGLAQRIRDLIDARPA